MRLVTIQSKAAYDELCSAGVLRCKAELSDLLSLDCFRAAYDWLVKQMKERIGEPPNGVCYPIWAWYLLDGKPVKVDRRRVEFNYYIGEHCILTLEVPDEEVLLSDETKWHFVLNDWFLNQAENKKDFDKAEAWFDSLPPGKQRKVKEKSWERIFDVTPLENDFVSQGYFVQATFWELRREYVVAEKMFIGRLK